MSVRERSILSVIEHARVTFRAPPAESRPLPDEPADLRALFAATDGLELDDGTRLLGRGEILAATRWLVTERALEGWSDDQWVIGERDDLVIVRDLDREGVRAGGGVLEAATDGLTTLARVAMDVIGYLEDRLGLPSSGPRAPERDARDALARRDADGIARALARGFYPGASREAWQAGLALGALHAEAGDETAAMAAFAAAVAARASGVPRGAEAGEARSGWKACAVAAEKAGARAIAAACRARAGG